ncbi:MAG: hypothetical protein ACLFVP_00185 [Candidatus Bathyarchaeia archaeon]
MVSNKIDKKVIDLIRDQIDVEARLISNYKNSVEGIDNIVASLILELLMLDSMKHLAVCKSAIKILEGETLPSSEKTLLIKEIDKHIELESEAYERINKIMGNRAIRNIPGLWSLLERIRYDERSHHEILMQISDKPFTPLNIYDLRTLFRRPSWFEKKPDNEKTGKTD